jgi:hypothetical protein
MAGRQGTRDHLSWRGGSSEGFCSMALTSLEMREKWRFEHRAIMARLRAKADPRKFGP